MAEGVSGKMSRKPRALEEVQLPFRLAGMYQPAHDLNTEAFRRLCSVEQIPSIGPGCLT